VATINLATNGRPYTVEADPQTSLLTVLRENLDLTATKYGCGEGQCGACTVLVDGRAQTLLRHASRKHRAKADHHH
jgi:aerobic-type carbon monoxide dehydrogenase small subunit (CoxS/CutS family)